MTDIEMTKLCAEAMGWRQHKHSASVLYNEEGRNSMPKAVWNPLHDDAQAIALVKKFFLEIMPHNDGSEIVFFVRKFGTLSMPGPYTESFDLNRAIVECVAKMQAATVT